MLSEKTPQEAYQARLKHLREYRKMNYGKIREREKRRYQKNIEAKKAYARDYYQKNKEAIKQKSNEYYRLYVKPSKEISLTEQRGLPC